MTDTAQDEILRHFNPEQAAHIVVLTGRVLALASLIEMLWTSKLAETDNPLGQAKQLKKDVLSLLDFDPADAVQVEAVEQTERSLDEIVHRVQHLDTPMPDQRN